MYSGVAEARKIRQILRELWGLDEGAVRPANQHAPLPTTGVFATVLVQSTRRDGYDDVALAENEDNDELVDENIVGQRALICSVQAFRAGAGDLINRAAALLQSSAGVAKCAAANVSLIRVGDPRDLSQISLQEWEERWQVDIEFYVQSAEVTQLETYGTFGVSTTIADETVTGEITEP